MNPAITHRHVIVRLLNGPIYQEDLDLWSRLGAEWEKIKGHFGEMGLDVARDDSAGYAYVRQHEEDSEEEENWDDVTSSPLPRVLRRTRLSYHQTIFMVLLREELMRFEQNQEEGDHLYRSSLDLTELMAPYYPELHDEKKVHRQIAGLINKFEEWGIIKKVRDKDEGLYRVERIIKAKLPPEKLTEVKNQIKRRAPELDEEMEEEDA
jgi:Cdc6-like AAA superfamily ATPase